MLSRSLLPIVGVALTAALFLAIASFSEEPKELLETVAVDGEAAPGAGVRLYEMGPNGAMIPVAQAVAPQTYQPVVALDESPYVQEPAAVPYVQAPIRYSYNPQVGYLQNPMQQQQQQIYSPYQQQVILPRQHSVAASMREIAEKKAAEISLLRKTLDEAEERESRYSGEVSKMKMAAAHEHATIKQAKKQLAQAKKLESWARVEKAAAKELKNVEESAKKRVQRQAAIVDTLLPKVRKEISIRRILERRIQAAEFNARSTRAEDAWERKALMTDVEIAQQAKQTEKMDKLAYTTMQQRIHQMDEQARHDKIQAKADIAEARASVVGARKSAAKTLAAIRASMKQGKYKTSQTEQNFARAARHATKEMSSKKRDAKDLREEAVALERKARSMRVEMASRQQQIPSAKAQAEAAEARAAQLRNALVQREEHTTPVSKQIEGIQSLAQISKTKSSTGIQTLTQSEAKMQKAMKFWRHAEQTAAIEEKKAAIDAQTAVDHVKHAQDEAREATQQELKYKNKIAKLSAVLTDAKQELAQLQTEADEIARNE